MGPVEIITIVSVSLILISFIGVYIYKKIKKIPTGECACCSKKGNKLLKDYHKKYKK